MSTKVLCVDHSSACGGGQISLFRFLKNQRGLDILLIINSKNEEFLDFCQFNDIPFVKFDFSIPKLYKWISLFFLFRRIKRDFNFDVLYANTFEAGFWCAILKQIYRVRMVFRARLSVCAYNHGIIDLIIYWFSDWIIANSQFVADSFTTRFGARAMDKISVILNPVSDDAMNMSCLTRRRANDGRFNVAIIGSISPDKGQLIAVEAIEHLLSFYDVENVKLYIVGRAIGTAASEYLDVVKEYCVKRGLIDRHVLFTGHVQNPTSLYSDIDVVVNCHPQEALSRVVYETQYAGIPNVVADTGGNLEMVRNRVTGMVFKSGSSRDLASRLFELHESDELYNGISARACEQVLFCFSIVKTVDLEIAVLMGRN